MNPQSVKRDYQTMSTKKREMISGSKNRKKNINFTYVYVKDGISVRVNPETVLCTR